MSLPPNVLIVDSLYDPDAHYQLGTGPIHEYANAEECPPQIRNIGWTLGNDCPYRCHHCYSMSARRKGQDMTIQMVNRIVEQLAKNHVETVNLGGNEPLFTNGLDPRKSLLPVIIQKLVECGIEVGLTTSGITLLYLYQEHRDSFDLLNDVDVSFDSPYEAEHNDNRGAALFSQALKALQICQDANKPHTIITAGMNWNFTEDRILKFLDLAVRYDAHLRVNPVKPVEPKHMSIALSAEQYYSGFELLMKLCDPVDLGEPPIAAMTDFQKAHRCPCGRTSFRIHSITPDGRVYVSPCVYLHDFKAPYDLMTYELSDIIASPQFKVFRQRNQNPHMIEGCAGCRYLEQCGGGCAARSYLHHAHSTGELTMLQKDPYCPIEHQQQYTFPQKPEMIDHQRLVHMDYLCTWIGVPKHS